MSRMNTFLENRVLPIAGRLAGQRHLNALRDGIILTMPLIIIGSVFLILANLPIPGYPELMASIFGDQWATKLQYPVGVTFDIMGLIAAFGIAYRLAEKYEVDALTAGAISLAAFLLATPYHFAFTPEGAKTAIEVTGGIPTALLGSKGLFVAMIIAMFSTEVYRLIVQKNLVIKMPDGVPPAVSKSFVALIPGFIVITVIWLARIFVEMTSYADLHNLVTQLIGAPLSYLGGSFWGSLIAIFVVMLLWVCGLHGMNIVGGVMAAIWYGAMDQNRLAFQEGHALPNIFTQQFFEGLNLGGSGITIGLAIAILFTAKSQQNKALGKLAIGPSIFNINEPLIFGMPIVLNPMMMFPFIIAPVTVLIINYLAMTTGIVAKPSGIAVPWTMPPILHGYLLTGGKLSGAIMQAVDVVVSFFIYLPFFKALDRQKVKEENQNQSTEVNNNLTM